MTQRDNANSVYELRKQPLQARAKATVGAILEAAARVLIEHGYAQASTNAIAERAGVSIGSLYEYFPGKEAIYAELRRRESLKHYHHMIAEPQPTAPRAMLTHLVHTHIAFVRDNLELLVALQNDVPRVAIAEVEASILDGYTPISNAFLDEHREALRPGSDTGFITEFLMRVLTATVNDYALRSPTHLETEELAQSLVDTLGYYLLKPD